MGPHNLIEIHTAVQGLAFYGTGFAIGSSAAVILVFIDRLNNGGRQ